MQEVRVTSYWMLMIHIIECYFMEFVRYQKQVPLTLFTFSSVKQSASIACRNHPWSITWVLQKHLEGNAKLLRFNRKGWNQRVVLICNAHFVTCFSYYQFYGLSSQTIPLREDKADGTSLGVFRTIVKPGKSGEHQQEMPIKLIQFLATQKAEGLAYWYLNVLGIGVNIVHMFRTSQGRYQY